MAFFIFLFNKNFEKQKGIDSSRDTRFKTQLSRNQVLKLKQLLLQKKRNTNTFELLGPLLPVNKRGIFLSKIE